MNKNDLDVIFSHESDEWETPDDLFKKMDDIFHFDCDVCATKDNTKCEKFISKEEDGLVTNWMDYGKVFWMNPPYSQIYLWLLTAKTFAVYNDATVICLLPARTDTEWFHRLIMQYHLDITDVLFIRGRLKFNNSKNSAPFPSMIVILNSNFDYFSIAEALYE